MTKNFGLGCVALGLVLSTPSFAIQRCHLALDPETGERFPQGIANEPAPENAGEYLPRNGYLIPVSREANVFTITLNSAVDPSFLANVLGDDAELVEGDIIGERTLKVKTRSDCADCHGSMDRVRARLGDRGAVHHAYMVHGAKGTRYYLTDQIIMKLGSGTNYETARKIGQENGFRVLRKMNGTKDTYLIQVLSEAGKNPVKLANQLRQHPDVAFADPDLIQRAPKDFDPRTGQRYMPERKTFSLKSSRGRQLVSFLMSVLSRGHMPRDSLAHTHGWHLQPIDDLIDSGDALPGTDMGIDNAFKYTRGEGVTIASPDDGLDMFHREFKGQLNLAAIERGDIRGNWMPGEDPKDPGSDPSSYHQTPVDSLIAAAADHFGIHGAAPGAKILPVKMYFAMTDSQIAEMFYQLSREAHIITSSWGPPPVFATINQHLNELIWEITTTGGPDGRGTAMFMSAGNSNAPLYDPDNTNFPFYYNGEIVTNTGPIWNQLADHPRIMAVGSRTSLGEKAEYSSYAMIQDEKHSPYFIYAPSGNFWPLDPFGRNRPAPPGLGLTTADNIEGGFNPGIYTHEMSGTSGAAPNAAGVAGLIKSQARNITPEQLYQSMLEMGIEFEPFRDAPAKAVYAGDDNMQFVGMMDELIIHAIQDAFRISDEQMQTVFNLPIRSTLANRSDASPPVRDTLTDGELWLLYDRLMEFRPMALEMFREKGFQETYRTYRRGILERLGNSAFIDEALKPEAAAA